MWYAKHMHCNSECKKYQQSVVYVQHSRTALSTGDMVQREQCFLAVPI